ncbi:MAG: SH3 domain-containing protein [Candidatus Eiseniibacteriota bacterium]
MIRILVNGRSYSSIEEMPPEDRRVYEETLRMLEDKDDDGIPDVLQGKRSGIGANVIVATSNRIIVNGKQFRSLDELPPEQRAQIAGFLGETGPEAVGHERATPGFHASITFGSGQDARSKPGAPASSATPPGTRRRSNLGAIQIALLALIILLLALWLGRAMLARAESTLTSTPAATAAATRAGSGVARLLPVDEGVRNPEFFQFRARLQSAIAARDTSALLSMIDPHIKNSFGGDDGIENFRKMWKITDTASGLWPELGLVLAMGGRFSSETTFAAPYVYSAWPDDVDAFEHVAIVGSDVRVRAAPKLDAERLSALSFAIVRMARDGNDGSADFTAIRLADGRTGYVSSTYVRSPIDHRAIFNRGSSGWRMTAFVAGD